MKQHLVYKSLTAFSPNSSDLGNTVIVVPAVLFVSVLPSPLAATELCQNQQKKSAAKEKQQTTEGPGEFTTEDWGTCTQ